MPNIAKKISEMPPEATENRRFRNSRRSSIGWRERHSHKANSARTPIAPTNQSSDSALAQPWFGPFDDGVDEGADPDERQDGTDGVER